MRSLMISKWFTSIFTIWSFDRNDKEPNFYWLQGRIKRQPNQQLPPLGNSIFMVGTKRWTSSTAKSRSRCVSKVRWTLQKPWRKWPTIHSSSCHVKRTSVFRLCSRPPTTTRPPTHPQRGRGREPFFPPCWPNKPPQDLTVVIQEL